MGSLIAKAPCMNGAQFRSDSQQPLQALTTCWRTYIFPLSQTGLKVSHWQRGKNGCSAVLYSTITCSLYGSR